MSSTYSTNLALELIGTGDQAGTWGNTTNTNLGTLIEQAISGYVTQAVSTGTDTTITIPNGATGVARNMYIELTGTGGTNTNLIVPANKKLYFIFNNASGAVTVKVSGQTGVSVPAGKKVVLASNGTDTVNALNYIADFGSNSATITQLTATSATITNLTLTSLVISNLSIASANVTTLTSASATITNLIATSASITTLTNNPTLSGGTANGVLYLNGSKVATSGSALVFDGTNLGIGTSSPAAKLDVSGAAFFGAATTKLKTYSDVSYSGIFNGASLGAAESFYMGSGALFFVGGGTERMRIDSSGNLGIGTSSPAYKLTVQSAIDTYAFNIRDTIGNERILIGSRASAPINNITPVQMGNDNTGNLFLSSRTNSASGINFYTNSGTSAELRAVLDSSGNLGLGVTPSTSWYSSSKAIQIGSAGAPYMGLAQQTTTTCDGYMLWGVRLSGDRAFQYTTTGDAVCAYRQNAGTHNWFTAASGTAGNPISFTQALTLNANGALVLQGGDTAASGVGVAFPATQSGSSNANTLDDYEEGTWTPTIIGTSTAGTATYPAERNGKYTKVGNVVYVYANVSWTGGTGTGNLRISGLPFTSTSDSNIFSAICIAFSNNVAGTANNVQTASVPPSGSEIQFEQYPVGGGGATSLAYDAAGQYSLGGFYYV